VQADLRDGGRAHRGWRSLRRRAARALCCCGCGTPCSIFLTGLCLLCLHPQSVGRARLLAVAVDSLLRVDTPSGASSELRASRYINRSRSEQEHCFRPDATPKPSPTLASTSASICDASSRPSPPRSRRSKRSTAPTLATPAPDHATDPTGRRAPAARLPSSAKHSASCRPVSQLRSGTKPGRRRGGRAAPARSGIQHA
jgi:hypothetical protein